MDRKEVADRRKWAGRKPLKGSHLPKRLKSLLQVLQWSPAPVFLAQPEAV